MFFNSEHQENKIKLEKLQEKMKKSEMERRELEYKFENLMKERNKCENSAIKTLKYRYERFLDEEKKRNKRNEHLLKMLERIDYQAATLAAKTERLKMLKAQHELYLMKNWIPNSSFKSTQTHLLNDIQPTYALPHKQLTKPKQYSAPQYRQGQQQHNINLKSDFVKYLTDLNEFHNIQNPILLNDGYNKNSSNDPNAPTNKQTISTNQSQFNYDTINNQLSNNFRSPNYDTFSSSYTNNNNNNNKINNNLPISQNQQNYKNPTYNIDYYETQSDNNNNNNNSYLQNNLPIIEIVPPVTTTINESLLQKSITNMNDYNENKISSNTTEILNNQCGEITNTEQMKNYQIKPQQLCNSTIPNITGSIETLPLNNSMLDKPINNNNNNNNTVSISNTSANVNNGTTNANINTNNVVVNDANIYNKNVMNNNNNNNNNNNTDNSEAINKFEEMNESVDKINLTSNIIYNDEENIKNGDGATVTIATTEQTTLPSPTPTTAAADIANITAATTINKSVHDINIEGHENIINTDNLLDKLNTINIDDLQEHMKNVNLNENENITNDVEKKEEQISNENVNVSDNVEGKASEVPSDDNVIDEINQIYDENNSEQQKLVTHPVTNQNNEIDDQSQENVITENYDLINAQPSYDADDDYQNQPEMYQDNPNADEQAKNPIGYDTINPATNEFTENPEYYQSAYAEESENYQPQQLEQQIEQDQSHLNTEEMYNPLNEYQENTETYDNQNYDKEFVQEAQPIVDDQTLNYDQYDYTTTAVDGENPEQQPAAAPNDTQNYDEYQQYQQQNENYDEYQQYYEQNPNDVAPNQLDDGQQLEQGQQQQQQQLQQDQQQGEPTEYYDVNNYVTTEQQDQQQEQEQEQEQEQQQQQSTNEIYNEENSNYDQGFVTATENYRNEDDESSTTYSENINNVPKQIFEPNENININAPNYLESETDESNNIQQTTNENVIQNDESDFDFSTN